MRFPNCLPVAPSVMEATVGGSVGIPVDPSLQTGKDKEKNLKKLRRRFIQVRETGARLEQAQEEKDKRKNISQEDWKL